MDYTGIDSPYLMTAFWCLIGASMVPILGVCAIAAAPVWIPMWLLHRWQPRLAGHPLPARLDALIVPVVTVALFVAVLVISWFVFTSPIGNAYLCDTPGSKVCR